jgi:hypothetical protein
MPGFGYNTFVGIVPETTWGTKVSPTTRHIEPVGGGDRLQTNEPPLISAGIADLHIHRARKVRKGPVECGGEISYELVYQGAETFLKAFFGKVTTSGATYMTHVFEPDPAAFAALVGYTLEAKRDHASANSFFYEGSLGTFLEVSVDEGGFYLITEGFVSEDVSAASSSTPALPTAPQATAIDDGTGSGLFWNAVAAVVTSFRLRWEWNLKTDRRGIASRLIKKPVFDGKKTVSGSFRCEFESLSHFNDFRAKTERALQLRTVGPAATGGNYEVIIDVPVALIQPTAEPQPDNEGIIYADIPFQGFSDGTNLEAKLTLKNNLTTVL